MRLAYVKGQFVPNENAKVSIEERGFRYGDGVFETIRVIGNQPLHMDRHMRRLMKGLETLKIAKPAEDLPSIAQQLIKKNMRPDAILRISVTRGIGSAGYLPTVTDPPTVVMETSPPVMLSEEPVTLWLANWRKPSRKALPVEAKLVHGLNSTLARLEAQENKCDEALILNANDAICEASSANIFWKIGGLIYTPDLKCGLLAGITRELLMERWHPQTAAFSLDNLEKATSVMICNSVQGARAVFELRPKGWRWMDDSLATQANEILGFA